MFHRGILPVKDEAGEEIRRVAERQLASVAHSEQPTDGTESSSETENSEPEPATALKVPIPSSTMNSFNVEYGSSCFGDVSALSSAVPTISSGTMKLLAPIIEAALENDEAVRNHPDGKIHEQLKEEMSASCRAVVLYRPRSAILGIEQYRRNASTSQENICESTPPFPLKPIPTAAPKKSDKNEGERLSLLNKALRRLNLDDDVPAGVELWDWRQETNIRGAIDATLTENNAYEDITSPEDFED